MNAVDQKILNGYLRLMKNLTPSMKLDLIKGLKASMNTPKNKESEMEEAFGSWHSTESAEELTEMIRSSRRINRQIEEF